MESLITQTTTKTPHYTQPTNTTITLPEPRLDNIQCKCTGQHYKIYPLNNKILTQCTRCGKQSIILPRR